MALGLGALLLPQVWWQYLKHDHSGGAKGAAIPGAAQPGTIIFWPQAASTIPAGWALCDGAGGRPDLRGKFLRGADGATYPVGSAGGADSVNLSHQHGVGTLATDGAGAHAHSYNTAAATGGHGTGTGGLTIPTSAHSHTYTSTTDGGGAHALSGSVDAGGSSVENRPPYRNLYFIVKL